MPYGDYTKENNFGELSGCESNTEGPKSNARPVEFCDTVDCQAPVTMQSTLDVQGKSTLNETEVIPPAITVGGQTFVPMEVALCVGISGGGAAREGEEGGGGVTPVMETFTLLVAQG